MCIHGQERRILLGVVLAASVSGAVAGQVASWERSLAGEAGQHEVEVTLVPASGDWSGAVEGASDIKEHVHTAVIGFSIDTTPPVIRRIFPEGNTIDPTDPRILYEVRDDAAGSGLSYFSGDFSNDSLSVRISGGMGYEIAARRRIDAGQSYMEVQITVPSKFPPETQYDVSIAAKDIAGNTAEPVHERFSSVPVTTHFPQISDTCVYEVPLGFVLRTNPNDVDIAAGQWIDVTNKSNFLVRLAPDSFSFSNILPAEQYVSAEMTVHGPATLTPVTHDLYTLSVLPSAKAGDSVTVSYLSPPHGHLAWETRADTPLDGWQLECTGPDQPMTASFVFNGRDFVPSLDDYMETWRVVEFLPAWDKAETRNIKFTVSKKPEISGRFEYLPESLTLDYIFELTGQGAADMEQSQAQLTASAKPYTSLAGAERLREGRYRFRFKNVYEGAYRIEGGVAAESCGTNCRVSVSEDYEAKAAAPKIEAFSYDYSARRLTARVADEGTDIRLLKGSLRIGSMQYGVMFDRDGTLEMEFEQPADNATASLHVVDGAGQSTSRSYEIFGYRLYSADSDDPQPQQPEPTEIISTETFISTRGCPKPSSTSGRRCYWHVPVQQCTSLQEWIGATYSGCERKYVCEPITTSGINPVNAAAVCDPVLFDKSPPFVRNHIISNAPVATTAFIGDERTPLNELKIAVDWFAHSIYARRALGSGTIHQRWNGHAPVGQEGMLSVPVPDSLNSEIVEVELRVSDNDGNATVSRAKRVIPGMPPDIELKTVQLNDAKGTVLALANILDETGIDQGLTELKINGTPCVKENFSSIVDTETYSVRESFACRVLPGEGQHLFSVDTRDVVGLQASRAIPFSVFYKPQIGEISFAPGRVSAGVPHVFVAAVSDLGGDLDERGFGFSIDGKELDDAAVMFSDGLLTISTNHIISDGGHVAQLTARDRSGNQAVRELHFLTRNEVAVASEPDRKDALRIRRIQAWEVRNGNGDDLVNPGETVRLFFDVENVSDVQLDDVSVTVRSGDVLARLESDTFVIPVMKPGGIAYGVGGNDIMIDAQILDDAGGVWLSLPLKLEYVDTSGKLGSVSAELAIYPQRHAWTYPVSNENMSAAQQNELPSLGWPEPHIYDVGAKYCAELGWAEGVYYLGDSSLASLSITVNGMPLPIEIMTLDGKYGTYSVNLSGLTDGVYTFAATIITSDGDVVSAVQIFEVVGACT